LTPTETQKELWKSQQIWKMVRESSIVEKSLTHDMNYRPMAPDPNAITSAPHHHYTTSNHHHNTNTHQIATHRDHNNTTTDHHRDHPISSIQHNNTIIPLHILSDLQNQTTTKEATFVTTQSHQIQQTISDIKPHQKIEARARETMTTGTADQNRAATEQN
jgi:hypothetical protein